MSLMKDFFKNELKTIQLKTGIRQLENIMNLPDWEKQLEQLISLMVDESNKPPFDLIGIDLKQRVISNAIVEDKDFIGLNPKFVRKALNVWWANNKERYYDRLQVSTDPQPEPVTWEQRTDWLKKWEESLGMFKTKVTSGPVLTPEEVEDEGQEKPKAKQHPSTPKSMVVDKLLHDEWIRANFDPYTGKKLDTWMPENEWIELNKI